MSRKWHGAGRLAAYSKPEIAAARPAVSHWKLYWVDGASTGCIIAFRGTNGYMIRFGSDHPI